MNRQLTAIMFADMVGYTALMQEDEDRAKASRDRNRESLVSRVAEHDGKILQFYGDGALSVFQSAIQAAQASIAIQEDLRSPPIVPVRIGLHTGDIIYDDEGVFGDGVNLAARVQALAIPGGILISEKVYDEVKNQRGIETRSMGSFALKNVKRPMEIWAITNPGLAVPDPSDMGSRPSQPRNSVAVLPFMNMSNDPENEFFSDGITEELINALTRINGLQVTARTSSFAFKGENRDIREIAEQLGVTTVLEGSVRRAGDRVRITAQLINAMDGYHLFSKSYDRELLNIFDTQDEIAETIATELQDRFEPCPAGLSEAGKDAKTEACPTDQGGSKVGAPEPLLSPQHFHDTEAYTEFLKGIHRFSQWTPEGSRAAIRHFDESIRMDPSCALPFSGKATAYTFLAAMGQMPGSVAYPRAREAAQKAMSLEEATGPSHAAMAMVLFFYDWNFDGAYQHFQKALTLTPGAAHLRQFYAFYLMAMGDIEAAEEELLWAVQMDPLSPPIRSALGEAYLHSLRFEEAENEFRRVLELDPDFRSAREALGWTYIVRGMYQEALDELEEINQRTQDPFKVIPHRMWALMGLGQEEEASQLFRLLEERREREPEISLEADFALAHMALGDEETALDYLEKAVERRLGLVVFLNSKLPWGPIRAHPRFRELVERIGLPEPAAVAG
jgi:TolB-like protein/class 3 adenylate cyclase/Tfp pilus assembly protein PilF